MPPKKLIPLFILILIWMLSITTWATLKINLFTHLPKMLTDPWILATFSDTFFAFLTFYLWLAYKETSNIKRILWFVLILALGNIAIASYLLIQLYRLPQTATWPDLLLRAKKEC